MTDDNLSSTVNRSRFTPSCTRRYVGSTDLSYTQLSVARLIRCPTVAAQVMVHISSTWYIGSHRLKFHFATVPPSCPSTKYDTMGNPRVIISGWAVLKLFMVCIKTWLTSQIPCLTCWKLPNFNNLRTYEGLLEVEILWTQMTSTLIPIALPLLFIRWHAKQKTKWISHLYVTCARLKSFNSLLTWLEIMQ